MQADRTRFKWGIATPLDWLIREMFVFGQAVTEIDSYQLQGDRL
jgi:hypothetical protein